MREHEDYGERTVENGRNRSVRDVQVLKKSVKHAVGAENCFPSVAANQVADPKRNNNELIENFLAWTRVERQEICDWITEKNGEQRNGSGDARGAEEHLKIKRIFEERRVVVEIPPMYDDTVADRPKAVKEHHQVGQK